MYDPFPERPSTSSFARTHCLSDPVDPTTYHISSTTPPRGIINIINTINNQYHSGVTNTPSHPYGPSPDSRVDHTNRNHHRMDLSFLSTSSIAIAPPHLNSTRCITRRPYVCLIRILPSPTDDSPAPDPSLLLLLLPPPSSAVLSVSHTAQLHVLQSSIHLTSLHLPIHHISSSFQLQDLLFLQQSPALPTDELSHVDRLPRTHRSKTMNSARCLREHTSLPSEDGAFKQ